MRRGPILWLSPLAVVFLAFGIFMLVVSYYQTHPGVFLILFFSSSLIVLLSLAFLVGAAVRLFRSNSAADESDET